MPRWRVRLAVDGQLLLLHHFLLDAETVLYRLEPSEKQAQVLRGQQAGERLGGQEFGEAADGVQRPRLPGRVLADEQVAAPEGQFLQDPLLVAACVLFIADAVQEHRALLWDWNEQLTALEGQFLQGPLLVMAPWPAARGSHGRLPDILQRPCHFSDATSNWT